MDIAVVGAGWAGLSAAVEAVRAGHRVRLFEMAPQPGGRARSLDAHPVDGLALDNGQHILIGAYVDTLALMERVGLAPASFLERMPLRLCGPDGRGLALPPGPALPAFVRAVLGMRHWRWHERLALLTRALQWRLAGFRCAEHLSVDDLCRGLPSSVRRELIDPLCVAALNTPAREASGTVWLRVLRDALFAGPGASDLLLPRQALGRLLPEPAWAWLETHGAVLHAHARVQSLRPAEVRPGWRLNFDTRQAPADPAAAGPHDAVVLAVPPAEAARLVAPWQTDWAARAAALPFEAIVTVVVEAPGHRLRDTMLVLPEGPEAPAQVLFDLGRLRDPATDPSARGHFAAVISGARNWLEGPGLQAAGPAVLRQLEPWIGPSRVVSVVAEKRATMCCRPGLDRPPSTIRPGLLAAGDYVAGPYPSTLEGAVRSGRQAIGLATRPIS